MLDVGESRFNAIGENAGRGFNMHTASGKRVFPMDLRVEDINVLDIAHSLSMQNRYLGHTRYPYSVAQHSTYMSRVVPSDYAMEALIHDCAEAYCGDMIMPLKYSAELSNFSVVEVRIDKVIRRAFELPDEMSKVVKEADTRMAFTERRDVLHPSEADWGPEVTPFDRLIKPMTWIEAKYEFLDRLKELGGRYDIKGKVIS